MMISTARKYLRDIRVAKGLSQKRVASDMGISQQYYAFIENGARQRDMSLSVIAGLARALDVSSDQLRTSEELYLLTNDANLTERR